MSDHKHLIFIHGLESSGQSSKAVLLREIFPAILTPDFTGSLSERLVQLYPILGNITDWTIIGSSFGGLMGAIFTCQHPNQVKKLILLAPALTLTEFAGNLPHPIDVPTVIIHGNHDDIVPLTPVKELAKKVFTDLTHHVVNDGHRLNKAIYSIDWRTLVE